MTRFPSIFPSRMCVAAIGLMAAAAVAAACGSGSTSASSTSSPTAAATGTAPARFGRGNRTPNPAIQTSIAEGTPFAFRNRTPSPAEQTAIAEGTRPAGRGGFGGIGQALTLVAGILSISETQLRTELQVPGATLASVAAAHGQQRAAFRQALIDATTQRLNQAVTAGTITQAQATQAETTFAANIDRLLDNPGAFSGPPPVATPTP
ncbi:MAG TPA: hypothetical protein VEZ14_13360 [Dehalococcoidia bacterium]|nr:hypothetical protein [Dehalococcoidia bacterium]